MVSDNQTSTYLFHVYYTKVIYISLFKDIFKTPASTPFFVFCEKPGVIGFFLGGGAIEMVVYEAQD